MASSLASGTEARFPHGPAQTLPHNVLRPSAHQMGIALLMRGPGAEGSAPRLIGGHVPLTAGHDAAI
eukprot:686736-Pyramimonas_sp.AAC.1